MEKRFQNRKFAITWFPEDSIVEFLINDEEIEKEDVIEMHERTLELTGKKKYGTLFMAKDFFSITSEARAEGAKPHYSEFVIVQAFVVKNLAQRLIGNFIMKFNSPLRETKMFAGPDEARKWLKGKIKAYHEKKKEKLFTLSI